MKKSIYQNNYQKLQKLIEAVDIANIPALSEASGVSQWQISRLLHGLILNLSIVNILKLASILQVPIAELLVLFAPEGTIELHDSPEKAREAKNDLKTLQQEYQLLKQQLEERESTSKAEFRQHSLEILESWLIQWPTAANAAIGNSELPATRLLPLVKPVEKLVREWGIETIGNVGEETAYDPQYHELMEGFAAEGETVKVRYVGYRQDDRILHRVKVSAIDKG
jgi:molecular chaperone GrpE (heat shock protein)